MAERPDRKRGGDRGESRLRAEQQAPAVEPVGDRPSVERECDQRAELDRSEQAGQERRAGHDEDLKRQRDERHLRAEAARERADLEQPEVA
jgi:hypothetical protein